MYLMYSKDIVIFINPALVSPALRRHALQGAWWYLVYNRLLTGEAVLFLHSSRIAEYTVIIISLSDVAVENFDVGSVSMSVLLVCERELKKEV